MRWVIYTSAGLQIDGLGHAGIVDCIFQMYFQMFLFSFTKIAWKTQREDLFRDWEVAVFKFRDAVTADLTFRLWYKFAAICSVVKYLFYIF